MEAPGSSWKPLEAPTGSWKVRETPGNPWKLLETPEGLSSQGSPWTRQGSTAFSSVKFSAFGWRPIQGGPASRPVTAEIVFFPVFYPSPLLILPLELLLFLHLGLFSFSSLVYERVDCSSVVKEVEPCPLRAPSVPVESCPCGHTGSKPDRV